MANTNSTKSWRRYVGQVAYPTMALFLFAFAGYALTCWATYTGQLAWYFGTLLNSVFAYLLFTPMHEAGHGNIKGTHLQFRGIEKMIGWLSGMALAAPYPIFRYVHFIHHKHTNDPEKDPDHWVAAKHPVAIFFYCLTIIVSYYQTFWKARKELLSTAGGRSTFYQGVIGELFLSLSLLLLIWNLGWFYPIVLWVLPALMANTFLAFVFDWLPHHPHDQRQRYLDTRIILFPGLSVFLISQNMHLIHHLYPGIPYFHYANAMNVLEEELIENGARIEDYRPGSTKTFSKKA